MKGNQNDQYKVESGKDLRAFDLNWIMIHR